MLRNLTPGTRVKFLRPDGVVVLDTVRCLSKTYRLLMPYAPNQEVDAVILTDHSWCEPSDILEILP